MAACTGIEQAGGCDCGVRASAWGWVLFAVQPWMVVLRKNFQLAPSVSKVEQGSCCCCPACCMGQSPFADAGLKPPLLLMVQAWPTLATSCTLPTRRRS